MTKPLNLIGLKFGRLTVIKLDTEKSTHLKYWLCSCICGSKKSIYAGSLRNGSTKSCGCLSKEITSLTMTTHGVSKNSPEYIAWTAIKARCYNKNLKNNHRYGGRGINMHQEWVNSFESFYSYIGDRPSSCHSIDRINNDGNYVPGNIKWSTPKEQANNRQSIDILTTLKRR